VSVESVIRSSPKRQLNRGSFATEVDGEPIRGSFAAEAAGEPGLGLIVCAEAPTVIQDGSVKTILTGSHKAP